MNRIINGKRYDTEITQCLAVHENMDNRNNIDWWSEALYRKPTGEFFLYGIGNARSKYAQHANYGAMTGGEIITPITIADAKKWAEQYMTAEAYKKIFGEVQE